MKVIWLTGGLWQLAEECNAGQVRWPDQQDNGEYGKFWTTVSVGGKKMAISGLDQPIDQINREQRLLNQRQLMEQRIHQSYKASI